ncbi:MAG: hypothetical protein M1820_009418 [Bogoriella megaspora]|nr:MAG: hypothetical protein M1820_009418 [Bogoriella megaspora]
MVASASSLMASPTTGMEGNVIVPTEYVELFREKSNNSDGALVYLGHPHGANTTRLEIGKNIKRDDCLASNQPTCSKHHTARNDICESLIAELNGDATISIPKDPRQVCYEGSSADKDQYCCVSWHNDVDPLYKGDLAGYATTIVSQCTESGVSGKIYKVPVGGNPAVACTDVCLSNRGTGC